MRRSNVARILTALLAAGCSITAGTTGAPDAALPDDTDRGDGTAAASVSLNEGYARATWSSGVTVTFGDCTMRFQSNGLPNHARPAEYAVPNAGVRVPSATTAHAAADPTTAQTYDVTIPTCPTVRTTTTSTSLGNVGYMISGASLFNPYEGDGATVALASNFSVDDGAGGQAFFVDSCNGHPTPGGQYHYHGLPPCVTAQVDTTDGPSHLIGIAVDGFPIYGDRDLGGTQLTASDLDECNGITSPTPEFPDGVYHYVLLDTPSASSSLRCYRGEVASTGTGGMGGPPMARLEISGCNAGQLLARLDSPAARVWSGVSRSLREPLAW